MSESGLDSCGCTPQCPATQQPNPNLPGVSSILSSGSISLNGATVPSSASGNPTISLINDTNTPAVSQYYGTDGSGVRGFFNLPSGTIGEIDTTGSIVGGPITVSGTIQLDGDSTSPGNSQYYGTNNIGQKGFFNLPAGLVSPLTTKGDLYSRNSSSDTRLGVGSDGQVLQSDSTAAIGLSWLSLAASLISFTPVGDITAIDTQSAIAQVDAKTSVLAVKGDLISFSTVPVTVNVGTDGQVLRADSTNAAGISWGTVPRHILSVTAINNTSSPYLLLNTDEVVEVDSSTGVITINLSLGATYTTGQLFTVKDSGNNALTNNITINTSGGQTLDGATSYIININSGVVSFYWNGSKFLTL